MSKHNLLPCPCCKGQANILIPRGYFKSYVVRCSKCCLMTREYSSPEQAAEHWNTRSTIDDIVTELEEEKAMAYDKWDGGASYKAYAQAIDIVKKAAVKEGKTDV